uniref:Putative secreted protein n=1 Tax=Anopheles marajoara TaxID=58244 RepID=A0A2M4CA95_9DIPT
MIAGRKYLIFLTFVAKSSNGNRSCCTRRAGARTCIGRRSFTSISSILSGQQKANRYCSAPLSCSFWRYRSTLDIRSFDRRMEPPRRK